MPQIQEPLDRRVVADENLQPYLQVQSKNDDYVVGLILGGVAKGEDFVIHFAKTPAVQTSNKNAIQSIEDISESWVADHAKHVTRMLPGGIHVLGIFIVSPIDLLSPFHQKLKTILSQMHKTLENNEYLFGNATANKIVLNFNSVTKEFTCKGYDLKKSMVTPVKFEFKPKPMKWIQCECKYALDETIPVFTGDFKRPLKKHLQGIVKCINSKLKNAVIFFDNETGNTELINLKSSDRKTNMGETDNEPKSISVSILIPCSDETTQFSRVTGGFLRIKGQIFSKVWLNPNLTIGKAGQVVIEDIVRSLAARFEMHSDSLVDEESGSTEDENTLHEPPRRVLITLPHSTVMLSDYLFPGEDANEALISVQELLDIDLQDRNNISHVEEPADLTELYPAEDNISVESEDNSPIKLPRVTKKFMYTLAFLVAVPVLIISIILQFMRGN